MKKIRKIITSVVAIGVIMGFYFNYIDYQNKVLSNIITIRQDLDMAKFFQEYKLRQLEKRFEDIVRNNIASQLREQDELTRREGIEDSLNSLKSLLKDTVETLSNDYEPIDVPDIEKLVGANFLIINKSFGVLGSGTHVKIKNKHYVLSCAHLLKSSEDIMVVRDEYNREFPIEIIKVDTINDLALFRVYVNELRNKPYVEIGEAEPKVGSRVVVVGNPGGNMDIVTTGNIAKIHYRSYLMTNLIYSGNSGGGIFYKGKLVGVTTQIRVFHRSFIYVNYGYGPNLKAVREFLREELS
jgi:S1-C subfamily serine protease